MERECLSAGAGSGECLSDGVRERAAEGSGIQAGGVRAKARSKSAKLKLEAGELHRYAVLEPQLCVCVCQRCGLVRAGGQMGVEPSVC